jgi:hypothetical protein
VDNISDDLDEDERAMLHEEEESNGEDDENGIVLTRQPSVVTGGAMRYEYAIILLHQLIRVLEHTN